MAMVMQPFCPHLGPRDKRAQEALLIYSPRLALGTPEIIWVMHALCSHIDPQDGRG